jgi:SAM-dependent methyltransferase
VPKNTFLVLDEKQASAFDAEFHRPAELDTKFTRLEDSNHCENFNALDLGGGNGLFADKLLARFPKSTVTILDTSALLLSKNKLSDRKELIKGSIEHIADIFADRTFDYIIMNWVLHHLVGNDYKTSRVNCLHALRHCKRILKPTGMVIIAENMFDGYLRSNFPSHLIYIITSIKWRWFVWLAKRVFNTAGVGVCFQSQPAWRRIFAEAGFDVVSFDRGLVWWWLRKFPYCGIHLLFVQSVSHGHFFLKANSDS